MEPVVRWLLTYLVHSTLLLGCGSDSPASSSASGGWRCRRLSSAPRSSAAS